MAGSGAARFRWVLLASALGVAAICLALAGSAAAEDTAPDIAGGSVTPSNLAYEGGLVQLSAEVTDDSAVQNVTAVIDGSDGSFQAIQLYEGSAGNFYGTFEAPANYTESPISYSVEIQAYDDANNYSATTVAEFQVEGAPQFDEPPYIGDTQLFPTYLPAEGGDVTIRVEAADNRALSEVFASVTPVQGTGSTEVPLQAIDFSRFEGTFHAPANAGPLAAEYIVEAVARDDIGQESRSQIGTVTVEAPTPPPLSPGMLRLRSTSHEFRPTKLGRQRHWNLAIRNWPRGRKGGVVSGTARIVGFPAFSLAGAGPEGIRFTLQPGERMRLGADFAPTAAGPQSATIEIVRDDGGQPGLSVALSGEGVAPRQRHPRRHR
jgi:hypothetical protein